MCIRDRNPSDCTPQHPCEQDFLSWMAYNRLWFMAVSYTHLDVYKRQVAAQIAEWWRMTTEEDTLAAARVQTGLRSGMYTWGYTVAESESNTRHFYGLVWKALAPAFRA